MTRWYGYNYMATTAEVNVEICKMKFIICLSGRFDSSQIHAYVHGMISYDIHSIRSAAVRTPLELAMVDCEFDDNLKH